jgi:hypothetical protein
MVAAKLKQGQLPYHHAHVVNDRTILLRNNDIEVFASVLPELQFLRSCRAAKATMTKVGSRQCTDQMS